MPKIQYSLQAEKAKRELVEKLMEGVSPVVIVPFDTGVAAATLNHSWFRKIRKIHTNVMIAAAGEYQDINEACLALVDAVSRIENTFSGREVSTDVLINDPTGIVGHISHAFRSLDIRPKAVEFILCSLAEDIKPQGVIINSCGERRYVDGSAVICDATGNASGLLERRIKDRRAETEEEAIATALSVLDEVSGSDISRAEIGILKKDKEGLSFCHRWEDR
ncbi:hypothetical protein IIA95_01755 [Patescibacteria group bacterium]|nr:hypothetical protein [Patescibacteria group bacterium]